jgi:hypothetical protein
MPTKTRQQRRTKTRAPARSQRKGQRVFVIALVALMAGGGVLGFVFRQTPRPITRGANIGEHWHAPYSIEICGKKLAAYPFVEGEIHTHGDGKVHIHPQTQAYALDNANLGRFLEAVETTIGREDGKNFITFPNGDRYEDGDKCPRSSSAYDLIVQLNGKTYAGDPSRMVLHDTDSVLIRFGPQATQTTANPFVSPSPAPKR